MFECVSEQVMTMFTWHVPGPFVEKPKNHKSGLKFECKGFFLIKILENLHIIIIDHIHLQLFAFDNNSYLHPARNLKNRKSYTFWSIL